MARKSSRQRKVERKRKKLIPPGWPDDYDMQEEFSRLVAADWWDEHGESFVANWLRGTIPPEDESSDSSLSSESSSSSELSSSETSTSSLSSSTSSTSSVSSSSESESEISSGSSDG